MCVGAALNQSLCVLRVKDGQMTSSRLPDLITALEWKKGQVEGDSPTLLVGLVSGQLLLAAVLRISMNLTPEIHTAYLEPTLKGAEDVYDNVQCLALEALCHVQQAFHSLISTHTHTYIISVMDKAFFAWHTFPQSCKHMHYNREGVIHGNVYIPYVHSYLNMLSCINVSHV